MGISTTIVIIAIAGAMANANNQRIYNEAVVVSQDSYSQVSKDMTSIGDNPQGHSLGSISLVGSYLFIKPGGGKYHPFRLRVSMPVAISGSISGDNKSWCIRESVLSDPLYRDSPIITHIYNQSGVAVIDPGPASGCVLGIAHGNSGSAIK